MKDFLVIQCVEQLQEICWTKKQTASQRTEINRSLPLVSFWLHAYFGLVSNFVGWIEQNFYDSRTAIHRTGKLECDYSYFDPHPSTFLSWCKRKKHQISLKRCLNCWTKIDYVESQTHESFGNYRCGRMKSRMNFCSIFAWIRTMLST